MVNKHFINYFLLCSFALILSCNKNTSEKTNTTTYFNIDSLIKNQSVILKSNNYTICKTITKDGIVETKSYSNIDWGKELDPFASSDINKPNWKLSYAIDSVNSNNLLKIKYTTIDSTLIVKSILVEIIDNKVRSLSISNHKKNSYFDSSQILELTPDSGYTIKGHQGVLLGATTAYTINARFIK